MVTSKKLTFQPCLPLTLSAEDSPASLCRAPGRGKATKTKGGSGRSSTGQFAKLAPDGSWLKMYQGFCQHRTDGSLEGFSENWPAAGTMRNGICSRRPPLVPRTSDTESSLWPTFTTQEAAHSGRTVSKPGQSRHLAVEVNKKMEKFPTPNSSDWKGISQPEGRRPECDDDLPSRIARIGTPTAGTGTKGRSAKWRKGKTPNPQEFVQMWPTPTRRDSRSFLGVQHMKGWTGAEPLVIQVGGQLNPTWVEWLMGYPLGWTDLNVSEMP